jgi:hypothetical protein
VVEVRDLLSLQGPPPQVTLDILHRTQPHIRMHQLAVLLAVIIIIMVTPTTRLDLIRLLKIHPLLLQNHTIHITIQQKRLDN